MIKEFAFVGYPVKDLAKAKEFYENVIGLQKASDGFDSETWVEYAVGTSALALISYDQWPPATKNGPAASLEVDNFEEFVKELKEKGVKFYMEPMDSQSCVSAVIEDPDGNYLGIHQRKQK